MIRSGEHALFDAHMATAPARAERAARVAGMAKAVNAAMQIGVRLGVSARQAGESLRRFADAMERAGDAQRIARGLPWDVETVRRELAVLELRGASRQQAERYLNLCARAGLRPSTARRAAGGR